MNIQNISADQELVQFINSPQNIMENTKRLYELIEVLCQKKSNLQIEYDGSNYCCYCQEFLIENNFKILPCGHNVHFECYKNYLIDQPFYIESIETYSCCKESETCSQVIITEQLSKLILGDQQFNNLRNQFELDQDDNNDLSDLEEYPFKVEQDPNINEENEKQIQDSIENDQKIAQSIQQQEELQKNQNLKKINFDCLICFESYDVESSAITLECDHRFCKQCIQEQIYSQMDIGKFKENDLVCPQCHKSIDFHIIQYCAPDCSQKINDLRVKNLDNNASNERLVRCPGKGCPEQYYISFYLEFPTCITCKLQFCANGCDKVHQGMTCDQYQKKTRTKQEKGLVSCPKCKIQIFKDGGCNHMTCKCKYEFCFVCSKPYKPKRECNCPQNTTIDRFYDRLKDFFGSK
ncbi:unnamed protein product [Paramecium primaurelia]|uniref:Uncharacterized protein n=1 Tax=Paramecium primaurelia TaxID=5886 RepID=A0A8S1QKY9_PARPR|nr:unnamed protein product [Paramecium primaurelia]